MEKDTTAPQPDEEVQADGYYGDDDAETDELDLSFLDDEGDDTAKDQN